MGYSHNLFLIGPIFSHFVSMIRSVQCIQETHPLLLLFCVSVTYIFILLVLGLELVLSDAQSL